MAERNAASAQNQGCQMAKFDPFLSLDCARLQGVGAQSKERKGSNFAAQRSGAIVLQARRAKHIQSRNLAIAIWQPCPDYLGGVFPQHSAIFLPRRRRLMCARTPILRCRAGRKIVFSQAIDSFSKIQLFLSWSAYHTDCPNYTFPPLSMMLSLIAC